LREKTMKKASSLATDSMSVWRSQLTNDYVQKISETKERHVEQCIFEIFIALDRKNKLLVDVFGNKSYDITVHKATKEYREF
jgi:hypothetical protein